MRGEDVQRRGDELDFNGGFRSVLGFGFAERGFDGFDAFVAETLDRDVSADFGGLGSEALGDVGGEFGADGVGGEFDAFPDVGVAEEGG